MKADGFCKYNESGVAGPLRAVGQDNADVDLVLAHGQANAEITEDQSPTLSLLHEAPIVFRKAQKAQFIVGQKTYFDVTPTLAAGGNGVVSASGGQGLEAYYVGAIPRRLTPTECERLQGFPDGWTRLKDDGTELADSPRYRMMGNAVTVNVAEWIGKRIIGQEKG